MELNRKNWFGIYYNWIYDRYPNDICSFFWGSLLIILLSPLVVIGRLLCGDQYDEYGNTNKNIGIYAMVGALVLCVYTLMVVLGNNIVHRFGYEYTHFIWMVILGGILGIFTFASLLALTVGILWTIRFLYNRIVGAPIQNYSPEIKDWWGGIRGKYCTKITWK